MAFTWITLKRLSNNKYIKNMYFWAIFVPIAAKALSLVKNPLELILFGESISIELSLPFSWSAFFCSAVFFSVALLLFNLFCPKIILENSTFSSYLNDGKSLAQLNRYAREVGAEEINITILKARTSSQESLDYEAQGKFWNIHEHAESYNKKYKFIISILYVLGFLVMAFVFFQNIIYVFEAAF
ncbi:hypothetical protein [Thalassolituus oleivorans]|uniref:hypothetical protein n=1 Tax=Thalassolituus oleivorans TaxID=187493 RepID=UPI001CE24D25|nr:hypothetical protein [Thalassolituus oleivorans]MCA6128423.1 hypothetical protein [Thalassolituus oleivorans 4BN06-13]